VLVYPHRWDLGFARISLHSPGNPAMCLAAAFWIWRATAVSHRGRLTRAIQGVTQQIRPYWKRWDWRRRLMFAAMVAGVASTGSWAINYLVELREDREELAELSTRPSVEKGSARETCLQYFARQCRRAIPAHGRILYRGDDWGMPFAYEVYPRRVFMLPDDMAFAAACWNGHYFPRQRGKADDPLDDYWMRRTPKVDCDPAEFVSGRGITHVVTFDRKDPAKCKIEAIR